jgi:tRNA(Ile)-lysidine synthase
MFPLAPQVRDTIRRHGMLDGGETVVVAVSGGADSTALLRSLVGLRGELGVHLRVAHFNHHLRDDAAADAAFVGEMARDLGLPYHEGGASARVEAARARRSVEDAARRLRYEFLVSVASAATRGVVATGHTLDDQAETVLMRVLRGAGPWGLSGIRPVRTHSGVRVIRPLIETPHASVEAALRTEGLTWHEDPTNRDETLLRNRVRHVLLPTLQGYNPDVRGALARLAAVIRDEQEALDQTAAPRVDAVLVCNGAGVRVALAPFAALPAALQRRALREAVRRLRGNLEGVAFVHLEGTRHVALAGRLGAVAELPGGLRAVRREQVLEITAGGDPPRHRVHRAGP